MYILNRIFVWLRRFPHSRGFGVQSPFAYKFLRYVVNEHNPYYAYAELKRDLPHLDLLTRKLAKLYFRMANYAQAKTWYIYNDLPDAYRQYIHRGSLTSDIIQDVMPLDTYTVALVGTDHNYADICRQLIAKANDKSILIIDQIYKSKETRQLWEELIHDNRTIITFDLYYCGIIFFDKKMYKANYIVNF